MVMSETGRSTATDQSVPLENLFDFKRFSSSLDLLLFSLWSPLGLCLFIIRTFIGLHALLVASLLPKRSSIRCFILRIMCGILGVVVKEENASIENKSKARVIVSNHITNIDHMAVDLVLPCIVPGVWDLPKVLNWGLGFHDFGVKQGRDVLIENVKMHLSSTDNPIPILCYPEGATTNGRSGLLKFSSWLFTLDTPIQPVFITVWRPITVSPSLLGSRWWSDLFWFLIVPFSVFTIKYLPTVKKSERESPEDYAKRVQNVLADALHISPTVYTDADKVELAKRIFRQNDRSDRAPTPSPAQRGIQRLNERLRAQASIPNVSVPTSGVRTRVSAQIETMAQRVKEVLPQVPLNVILKDIKVTTNVDETITRLLDGTVRYVPEPLPPTTVNVVNTKSAPNSSSNNSYISTESSKPFYCGSSTFGKNAGERTKSYQERKEALIQAARQRYLERHDLMNKNTGVN